MSICWGVVVKEVRRCERDAGKAWFCPVHRAQPKYFSATVILAVACSYMAALIPSPFSGPVEAPLVPSDFQLRLEVSAHAGALRTALDYKPPQRVLVNVAVGPIRLRSEAKLQERVAREHLADRNPNRYWTYEDLAPFVESLRTIRRTELVGQEFTARVPVGAFRLPEGAGRYDLDVFVRGNKIRAKADSINGMIEVTLTKEMIGL